MAGHFLYSLTVYVPRSANSASDVFILRNTREINDFELVYGASGNDKRGSLLGIEKFKGENFHLWKFKMEMVFEEKDLSNIVRGDEVEPTDEGTNEAQRRQFQKRERSSRYNLSVFRG